MLQVLLNSLFVGPAIVSAVLAVSVAAIAAEEPLDTSAALSSNAALNDWINFNPGQNDNNENILIGTLRTTFTF